MTTNDKPGLTQADGDEEERLPWERDAELMRLRRERDKAAETQAAAPETETQAPEKPLETVPETDPTDNDDPADTYARAAEGHKRYFSERIRRTGARLMGFIKEREKRSALSDVADQKKEKRRQYSAFFMVTAAAVIVIAGLVWFGETTFKKNEPKTRTWTSDYTVVPDALDKESFQTQYEDRLALLNGKLAGMEATIAEINGRLGQMKNGPAMTTRQRKAQAKDGAITPAVPVPPGTQAASVNLEEELRKSAKHAADRRKRLTIVKIGEPGKERSSIAAIEHPIAANINGNYGRSTVDMPIARNRAGKEAAKTYLPAGSFMKATVLSGVTAPTGGNAAANPMPMLLEVTDTARLPNDFRARVKRCFVTASATGDLSSERVLVRLDRLSCMTREGKAVDVRVQGYVTGEDGKTGVRGRLVTRSGQAVANAIFLGALSGIGEAVSLSAQNTTTYAAGNTSTNVTNPWKAGLGEGMSDAMDRIVNYYLRLADKIFPVLELDGGRQVEVVLSQGVTIGEKAGDTPSGNAEMVVAKPTLPDFSNFYLTGTAR